MSREKTKNHGEIYSLGISLEDYRDIPKEYPLKITGISQRNIPIKTKEYSLPTSKRPTRRLFERGGYIRIPLQKQAVLEANFDCF